MGNKRSNALDNGQNSGRTDGHGRRTRRAVLLLLCLALILAAFNWSALRKEPLLTGGTVMYLQLAPVDPRALLLGDYMALEFRVDREVTDALYDAARKTEGADERIGRRALRALLPRDGLAVIALSPERVASFARLDDGSPLAEGEHRLYFRLKDGSAEVAARSFFFQEGHATDYEAADYGEIHVDADGRNLLTHLLDKDLRRIEPVTAQQ